MSVGRIPKYESAQKTKSKEEKLPAATAGIEPATSRSRDRRYDPHLTEKREI